MLKTLKVRTTDLDIGMYVSGLDRPWLETPFFTQGFLIEGLEDLDHLRRYCEFVFVDSQLSGKKNSILHRQARRPTDVAPEKISDVTPEKSLKDRPRIPIARIFDGRELKAYADDCAWEEEHPTAQRALNTLIGDIDNIFDHLSAGEKLNVIK